MQSGVERAAVERVEQAVVGPIVRAAVLVGEGRELVHQPFAGQRVHEGDIGVRFGALPQRTMEKIQNYVADLAAGKTPSVGTKTIPPGVLIKKKT